MTEPIRTTCPFCLNGCVSGVVWNGVEHEMRYFADAEVNRGRLCPRGSSASVVVDHRERLCRPLLDGRDATWSDAEAFVRNRLAAVEPAELAFVYSRARTADEVRRLHGLAKELGTANLACGHVEPENGFNYRLEGVADATLAEVESARAILLVGDVFSTSPVASWRILEARYADRRNRLVVMDSIRTRQAGFAHVFIQVRPGTEPFALLALAALVDSKAVPDVDVDRYAARSAVSPRQLETAAAMLGPGTTGFVGSAMHTGRVYHPALHSLACQLVARAAGKPFVGFRESALPPGPMKFADLRAAMSGGRVRFLFWTGGLFPGSYAGLLPEMEKVEHLVATSIFIPDPPVRGLVLPLTAELERASTGRSYWGRVDRAPLAAPLDGTRTFESVLEWFGKAEPVADAPPKPAAVSEVSRMASRAAGLKRDAGEWLLVGEKAAIGLRGFYDPEDTVAVSPVDAARLRVEDGGYLRVKSPAAEREFRARVTGSVPSGTLAVGANVHRNRALFPLAVDELTGEVTVTPVPVAAEKAERVAVAASENRSVWR